MDCRVHGVAESDTTERLTFLFGNQKFVLNVYESVSIL